MRSWDEVGVGETKADFTSFLKQKRSSLLVSAPAAAMAGQIPDLQTLNSWEDAFQSPLPVVRKLEQQLRKNIDDNRSKLRSLVGASYRDLLGTAERIIEMDQQMETVEKNLGEIGRRCNARTIERVSESGTRMRKSLHARHGGKHSAMAQTKVLQSALRMVSRIVKSGGDALQASKLLVLSRLLFKSVSDDRDAPSILEELRRKLASLRKKLLSFIAESMVRPSEDKHWQVNVLRAYALVTSSVPKDALRHFLQVRYEQLDSRSDSLSENDIFSMLDLYSQTLLDTRDLFPRRFSEALEQLAKSPLIHDEQVRSAYELNLDVYGQWISEDVRTFTPWVRHDQLSAKEVSDALAAWSKQAQECLLRGVEEFLEGENDAVAVAKARHKLLSKYMSLSGKLRDGQHSKTIHGLRETFLRKLQNLSVQAAEFGDANFDLLLNASDSQPNNASLQSMWDLASGDTDLGQGALKFRQSIVQNRNSRTAPIQAASKRLDDWLEQIDMILDLVDNMRAEKWDDDLDLELDDIEDSNDLLQSLNKSDPNELQRSLSDAAVNTLNILGSSATSDAAEQSPAFSVRILREVNQRHRALGSRLAVPISEVPVVALHQNLAQFVAKDAIDEYTQSATKEVRVAKDLWDGSPPLPVQPSPAVFRFLKSLHEAMSSAGSDLWSLHAVQELKGHAIQSLSTVLNQSSFKALAPDSSLANGHAEDGDRENDGENLTNGINAHDGTTKDRILQNLFNVQYLGRVFQHRDQHESKDEGLEEVARAISAELELDEASKQRLEKNANDYWRRSYLLFGLLASS